MTYLQSADLKTYFSEIPPSSGGICSFDLPNNALAGMELESILKLPYEQFVEENHDKRLQVMKNPYGALADISLSITTGSCYNLPISHIFTNALNQRFGLNGNRNIDITTCLHEAVNNAILHGNLEVKSDFRTVSELYGYHDTLQQRISDNYHSSRLVNIGAWINNDRLEIAVSDEGKGFNLPKNIIHNNFSSGRGLLLIHTLSDKVLLGKDRRTLFMTFDH